MFSLVGILVLAKAQDYIKRKCICTHEAGDEIHSAFFEKLYDGQ